MLAGGDTFRHTRQFNEVVYTNTGFSCSNWSNRRGKPASGLDGFETGAREMQFTLGLEFKFQLGIVLSLRLGLRLSFSLSLRQGSSSSASLSLRLSLV